MQAAAPGVPRDGHRRPMLFILANVLQEAFDPGMSPADFIGVRKEPAAHESVVMLPLLDGLGS